MDNAKKTDHIQHLSPSQSPVISPTLDHKSPFSSPDISPTDLPSPSSADMALVAHNNPSSLLVGGAGINKRYRPAPAKTFQCRGYGECRMVFSRSEHLARHIRKHTGERPFTCHCGKQFSRLDNLRQHAQTVHADKQDQNEQMMRDLTSLHATMAAATKTVPRGKRSQGNNGNNSVSQENDMMMNSIKQEDMGDSFRGRPGTSTGYEGDHNGIIYQGTTWHVQSSDMDRATSRPTNNHSFRDPGQSFLAPSPSTSSQSQSFLGFSNTFSGIPDFASRPGSSSSRPPTAGAESLARTLPPLAAIVSAALPATSSGPFPIAPQSTQHILPVPGSLAFRRPSTATRPGTAPASYFAAPKSSYNGGAGLGGAHRPEQLPLSGHGRVGELASSAAAAAYGGYDAEPPTSPTGLGAYESPFSFHPPSVADAAAAAQPSSSSSPPPVNPRKRPFPGSDGDDGARRESGPGPEYDYGSESRPQSRRLSVMELCNDADADAGTRAILQGSGSRPTTSSGITASASALALVDRAHFSSTSSSLFGGVAPPATGAAAPAGVGAAAGGGAQAFGGGGIYSEPRRDFPTSATTTLFSALRGSFASPPLSDASSPRSATSPFATRAGIHSKPPSPDAGSLSRRGGGESRVTSPHSPAALGMRV